MQDGWSSLKEATDVSSDEQYDPDTVYGERGTPVVFFFSTPAFSSLIFSIFVMFSFSFPSSQGPVF